MNKLKQYKWVIAIGTLLLIQLIRINKTNPDSPPEKDFIVATNTPIAVANILKTSCYDCHSNQTEYPWYFEIAPLSWWLKHHVKEGREELNFSEWTDYSSKRKDHKLEEAVEQISEGEMPMYSYTLVHKNAVLSKDEQTILTNWFTSLRTFESKKN